MKQKEHKLSIMIREQYFRMKMEDLADWGFFLEFREIKPFWSKRLEKYMDAPIDSLDIPVVFLVRDIAYRYRMISVWNVCKDFISSRYSDAIHTEYAYCMKIVNVQN